jgi:hypothetical protein
VTGEDYDPNAECCRRPNDRSQVVGILNTIKNDNAGGALITFEEFFEIGKFDRRSAHSTSVVRHAIGHVVESTPFDLFESDPVRTRDRHYLTRSMVSSTLLHPNGLD